MMHGNPETLQGAKLRRIVLTSQPGALRLDRAFCIRTLRNGQSVAAIARIPANLGLGRPENVTFFASQEHTSSYGFPCDYNIKMRASSKSFLPDQGFTQRPLAPGVLAIKCGPRRSKFREPVPLAAVRWPLHCEVLSGNVTVAPAGK